MRVGSAATVILAASCIVARAVAQSAPVPPALDARDVESWVDAQVGPALKGSGVPGALVVIVRGDRVILSKGYGFADVERRIPMSADRTLVDIASIGKSMTAVIASQLIDEGVLDPDADVNHYLKSVHVTGPTVTLRMLLGHRGAFDSDLTGLFVPIDGDTRMPPGEINRRLRPVRSPGWVTAYDNQGYGVIGLALADVTGKTFATLYRERLFDPAAMPTAVQGRPADGDARLARCYVVHGPGEASRCPYWLYRDALRGAGGVAASGDDMARYMRLLLNGGRLDGRQVLSTRAYAALTDFDAYRFRSGMPGFARSFTQVEEFRGLTYVHGGSMPGFSSIMKIYKDADIAIFTCVLGGQPRAFDTDLMSLIASRGDLAMAPGPKASLLALEQLSEHFADQFIPAGRPRSSSGAAPVESQAPEGIEEFLGRYRLLQDETRSFPLRIAPWLSAVEVVRMGVGEIGVAGQGPYHRIGPLLYEDARGRRVAFAESPVGRLMALGLSPATFRRTNLLESPVWTLPLMAAAVLVLLSAPFRLSRGTPPRLRTLARGSLGGFALVLTGLLLEWQYGVRLAVVDGAWLVPALWRLGLLGGAGLLTLSALRFARSRAGSMSGAALSHGVLIAGASLGVVLVLIFWRVIASFPPYVSW
jgi:CubicO group peptidase (beta-lactamase class C family)